MVTGSLRFDAVSSSTFECVADRVALAPGGGVIVAAGSEFSLVGGRPRRLPEAPSVSFGPIVATVDGAIVAAPVRFDPTTGEWQMARGSIRPPGERVTAACWTARGASIAMAIEGPEGVDVVVSDGDRAMRCERDQHWASIGSLAASPDRLYGTSVRIECWSLHDGRRRWATDDGRWQVTAARLVGRGMLVAGRADGGVESVDAATGALVDRTSVGSRVVSIVGLPESAFVTATEDGVVRRHGRDGVVDEVARFDRSIIDMDIDPERLAVALDGWPPAVVVGGLDEVR